MKWLIKLCLCLPLLAQAQVLTVKVPSRPVNNLDQEYQYKLLELALTRSGQPFRIQPVELDLNQFTLQQQLSKGKTINVFWMGTSSALESSLIAVPIPLFRGLEGLRLSFIHADAQEKFNQINNLADLKQLKVAQGVGWADNKILENAGIPTFSGRYSSLFRLINDGDKIDFFPRALVEIFAERSELVAQYPNLAIEQHLLIPAPLFPIRLQECIAATQCLNHQAAQQQNPLADRTDISATVLVQINEMSRQIQQCLVAIPREHHSERVGQQLLGERDWKLLQPDCFRGDAPEADAGQQLDRLNPHALQARGKGEREINDPATCLATQ